METKRTSIKVDKEIDELLLQVKTEQALHSRGDAIRYMYNEISKPQRQIDEDLDQLFFHLQKFTKDYDGAVKLCAEIKFMLTSHITEAILHKVAVQLKEFKGRGGTINNDIVYALYTKYGLLEMYYDDYNEKLKEIMEGE